MSVGLKHGYYWREKVVTPTQSHGPHDWRAVNPRMRKRILRGILPEEFEEEEKDEVQRLLNLLDDLDNLPS